MASVKIEKPRALAHDASRFRAAASSGDSACRLTPPFGVPPSFAMSTCRCHRRSSRTAPATLMSPPRSCRASYSGGIVALQSSAFSGDLCHAQSSRPQPHRLRRRDARPAMAGRGPHRRELRAELRGGRREHHPERRPRVRGLPVRDAGRHADPGRPRPLDRIAVRVRQPRRLLAHPADLRRAQHAFHLMGGRPRAGAQSRRRQGDGRGRPRGGEPRLALDQLQGFHARAGARPHQARRWR